MPHWLDQYATKYHEWQKAEHDGRAYLYRPFGIVETTFDTDGIYFEGRADVNAALELEVSSRLTDCQLRNRILLAWTALRLQHVLLMSKAVAKQEYMLPDHSSTGRFFLICPPDSPSSAVQDASLHLVFTDRHCPVLDFSKFYRHTQNASRVIDASLGLSRVFVLPIGKDTHGKTRLRFLFVMSHQITDGLTNYTWLSHFIKLLNTSISELHNIVSTSYPLTSIQARLPLPQEDLYPAISGSRARKRWFWLLTLVLRHVKTPMPAAFPNPLRRENPLNAAQRIPPDYDPLLDYSRVPPLNSFTCAARVPKSATTRLHRLCREVGASIGAGCFVLVAMAMMALHETRYPDIPASSRQSFIGSFPINPRPFFDHYEPPDSMMLAFSDGVVLPFLPSDLDVEARFRLLVRQAHRQLSLYQKRNRPKEVDLKAYMGSRGAGRILANNYIGTMERLRLKLPEHLRNSLGSHSPQGGLPVQKNPTMATCGVSSVGRSGWRIGEYDVNAELPEEGEDAFVADYRSSVQNVRVRDDEFLVGVGGDDESIFANVSYDGNAIDEDLVMEWRRRMETLLVEPGDKALL